MQAKFTWKKKAWSNIYIIYSDGQQIGMLREKTFSNTVYGEFNGKTYSFKTKGFFKQHTEITGCSENMKIGEITFNNWKTKAVISVDNQTVNWKYDNFWNTKWSMHRSDGNTIQYSGSSSGGQIESEIDDAALLLSGLFVTNYFWQISVVVIVAVIIPLFAALSR